MNPLLHAIYIELPGVLKEELDIVHRQISSKYPDRRRSDTFVPHLNIHFKSLLKSDTSKYIDRLKSEFDGFEPFDLQLGRYSLGSRGYIFIDLSKESQTKLYKLNDVAEEATQDLKSVGELPSDSYKPHISLTKLEEYQSALVLKTLANSLENVSFTVDHFVISQQEFLSPVLSRFPIVARVESC